MKRMFKLRSSDNLTFTCNPRDGSVTVEAEVEPIPGIVEPIQLVSDALDEGGVPGVTRRAIVERIHQVIDQELVMDLLKQHVTAAEDV